MAFSKNSVCMIFFAAFFSCNNSKKDDAVFEMLNEGLERSNQVIDRSSEMIYKSIEDKTKDPSTAEKANYLFPKVKRVDSLTNSLNHYIDELKTKLKHTPLDKEDVSLLFKNLVSYRENLLTIDSFAKEIFEDHIILVSAKFDTMNVDAQTVYTDLFMGKSSIAYLTVLNQIKNNIKATENKFSLFFHNRTSSLDIIDEFFSPLVGQNSTYLKPGEILKITAGIGSFSHKGKPEIRINQRIVPLSSEGTSHYQMRVLKPGKHFIPVEISYTDQDGKKQTAMMEIEYTVADTTRH